MPYMIWKYDDKVSKTKVRVTMWEAAEHLKIPHRYLSMAVVGNLIWVSSESANAADCKSVSFGRSRGGTYLAHHTGRYPRGLRRLS